MYRLHAIADVLRAAGLAVKEQPGWKERGHGDMKDVRAVLCHHTAGPKSGNMPSLQICVVGNNDLPGPRCNLCLGRDGTYYVVAAGKGYHAGKGSWRDITDSGNSYFIGIEAEATGVDTWPAAQMEAYARGCAALVKHFGLTAEEVIGHKEYAPKRKIDPNFDMDDFRKQVAEYMQNA